MRPVIFGVATLALASFATYIALAQQGPKDIIAAQIRSQGYACDHPAGATRDTAASKPYGVVWILKCENSTYRVTLVPNLAAEVEVIDESERNSPGSK